MTSHTDYPAADPSRIVDVLDYSETTLRNVLAHVEASTTFNHFVYREAELDTLLRLTTTAVANAELRGPVEQKHQLGLLVEAVVDAHNFVGEQKPGDAARRLHAAIQLVIAGSNSEPAASR